MLISVGRGQSQHVGSCDNARIGMSSQHIDALTPHDVLNSGGTSSGGTDIKAGTCAGRLGGHMIRLLCLQSHVLCALSLANVPDQQGAHPSVWPGAPTVPMLLFDSAVWQWIGLYSTIRPFR
jgi:hypothetical protein